MKEFKLRTWKTEDTKSLAQAANNPNIAKNLRNAFPNPYTSEDAVCFIKDCISKEGKNQITYAIEVDGKAVGSIGIFVKDDIGRIGILALRRILASRHHVKSGSNHL